MYIQKLASAVKNNVLSGLQGLHVNSSMSDELLEDTVVNTRLSLLKQYHLKGALSPKDLYVSINCIPVECKNIERCPKCLEYCGTPTAWFEIPQLADLGSMSIEYLGSIDRQIPFNYFTNHHAIRNHQFKKRGKKKPYVWIDSTPNDNGMYDCFVFNAPLLNQVSITAIFKDPRQLENYGCCVDLSDNNLSYLDSEIINAASKEFLQYYRQLRMQPMPNNQEYTP